MMELIGENAMLKFLSLALAVGVWFYVRGEDRPLQIFSVPIELQNIPDDLAIGGDVMESVSVRVRAPEIVLRNLSSERFLARVDLSGLGPGDQLVRIRPEAMRIPPGIEIVRITPELVPLRIERKVDRVLPVKPRFAGDPAPGYVVDETRVEPSHVRVEGPESVVRQAREVLTDVLRVTGRDKPIEAEVGLTPDRSGLVVADESQAVVYVDIHERYVTRVIDDVMVEPSEPNVVARLHPLAVSVTLEGSPGALADLSPGDVAAVVDVAALAPRSGEYRVRPQIVFRKENLVGRVMVKSVSSEEISVRIARGRGR